MIARSSKLVPLRFGFSPAEDRQEGWGRFLDLGANGGRVLSRFRLDRGDRIRVSFDLSTENFKEIPAQVFRSWKDEDGYFVAELRFRDEVEKARLGRVLRDFLARSYF